MGLGVRICLMLTRILQFASVVIVLGLTAHLTKTLGGSKNTIYEMVIGAISSLLFLPSLLSPILPKLGWYAFVVDYVMSYLWLAAFILTINDYTNGADCAANAPPGGNCTKKYAVLAFSMVALFFTWISAVLEIFNLWAYHRAESTI